MSESIKQRLLPWVRMGATTLIQGAPVNGVATFNVAVSLDGNKTKSVPVALRGPGDVAAIDPRAVIRVVPRPGTTAFETNFFPFIEFSRSDFPWLFTPAPATPDAPGLKPWIALVVVKKQKDVTLSTPAADRLPVLKFAASLKPSTELPDLEEAWAWAHAQVTPPSAGAPAPSPNDLFASERALSRLLCPRRLAPNEAYYACLVPTYAAGRDAGLLKEPAGNPLDHAWTSATLAPFDLPVYYWWEFRTGPVGDFETLVEKLEGRPLPSSFGRRPVDVSAPGFGLPATPGTVLDLEGALTSGGGPGPWPDPARPVFRESLRPMLDQRPPAPGSKPRVAPPLHGQWYAARDTAPQEGEGPEWLREINLDPRLRAVAGLGALVVQNEQEDIVAGAWDQLGDLQEAHRLTRQAELAKWVGERIHEKHVEPLTEDGELLLFVRGASSRIKTSGLENPALGPRTLLTMIASSRIPEEATSAAFRRVARPGGPLVRRLFPKPTSVFQTIDKLNTNEFQAEPPPVEPAGAALWDTLSSGTERTFEAATKQAIEAAIDMWPSDPLHARSARATKIDGIPGGEDPPNLPGEGGEDVLDEFSQAAMEHQEYLLNHFVKEADTSTGAALPENAPSHIHAELDPARTLPARMAERIQIEGETIPGRPIVVRPRFQRPMFQALLSLSRELLAPGLNDIPPNSVSLALTNRRFIEAYMLGLNHALAAELSWRRYPADPRTTFFERFWGLARMEGGAREEMPDITPIETWETSGSKPAGHEDPLVLIIRGELLQRYPGTTIHAVKAVISSGLRSPSTMTEQPIVQLPIFQLTVEPDITLVGFNLTPEEARGNRTPEDPGWYFLLQEHATEPHFGLDVALDVGGSFDAWNELSWGDLVDTEAQLGLLSHVPLHGRVEGKTIGDVTWAKSSAHMAFITTRRPVCVARHAETLLPNSSG